MSLQNHAYFQVATKALLFHEERLLVLFTPDGAVDFPGGRVDETEVDLSWPESLKREVAEELGPAVSIAINETIFVAKRTYTKDDVAHHIAAIYFRSEYLGGDVQLSDEHGSFSWMTPQELLAIDRPFVSDDEKIQLQSYFADKNSATSPELI